MKFAFALLCASFAASTAFAEDGQLMFLGAWPHHVLVFDAVQEKIIDKIELPGDVTHDMLLSPDKTKIYATTLNDNAIVTIDVATRKVTSSFTINSGNTSIRLGGVTAAPGGRYLYAIGTPIVKKIDRYEIQPVKFVVIDLDEKKVSRLVDIPKEEAQYLSFRAALRSSPDGKYLYVFRNDIIVFDTTDFKLVKKIELYKPPVTGMENLSFFLEEDPNEAPGKITSVFNSSDPYVHRQVFGIAEIDLASLKFDFTPVGPATTQMMSLLMTPDRKVGYTVAINGQHGNRRCEFWSFDMATRKPIGKAEFDGRTRFYFAMSADGKKLFTYGAGYEISVYDARTFKLLNEVDVNGDITSNMVVLPVKGNASLAAR